MMVGRGSGLGGALALAPHPNKACVESLDKRLRRVQIAAADEEDPRRPATAGERVIESAILTALKSEADSAPHITPYGCGVDWFPFQLFGTTARAPTLLSITMATVGH